MPVNDTERRRMRQRVPSPLREATVQDPALDNDGMLRVEIDAERGAIHHCPWAVCGATSSDPTPGDAAAVMESDGAHYWAMWWPNG